MPSAQKPRLSSRNPCSRAINRTSASSNSNDAHAAPATTPMWPVLFGNLGALVTGSSGILSDPAIIAREYRVPAVVATGNATRLLRDGQTVVVDGDRGAVSVVL